MNKFVENDLEGFREKQLKGTSTSLKDGNGLCDLTKVSTFYVNSLMQITKEN